MGAWSRRWNIIVRPLSTELCARHAGSLPGCFITGEPRLQAYTGRICVRAPSSARCCVVCAGWLIGEMHMYADQCASSGGIHMILYTLWGS